MKLDSYMPVRLVTGPGAVTRSAAVFASYGKRCLIIAGAGAESCGALGDCISALNKENIAYEVFFGITPNPTAAACLAAGAQARAFGAAFIVGIGGGSQMDAAKAAAVYAADPALGENDIYARAVPAKALPVLLIGTTAGTGSEVTGVSVLTRTDNGKKKSISGPDCYAAVSFCDYRYTLNMPYAVTVSTALDAFAHAAESFLASSANELSLLYAEKAMRLLRPFLFSLSSKTPPDDAGREAMYAASLYAGLAINISGTCFPHTVGYFLTERYGVPHGLACIAFLPRLLRRAYEYCPERLGAMEKVMDMRTDTLCALLARGVSFNVSVAAEEAEKAEFSVPIANFNRTPGGFTVHDARCALASFREDFPG